MGGMAWVRTPSMRNLMTTESSRVSMWISLARRRSQLVDGDGLIIARFVFADHVEREAFAGIFQNALRLLRLLENLGDLLERRNLGDDALAQQQTDLVDHHQ